MVIGDATLRGSVYTFKRTSAGPWVQVGAALPGTHSFERFGASLALKDNLLVVGAPAGVEIDTGAVYVFESNPAGGWRQIVKLTASDGVSKDLFGAAVAVSDDGLILVGAPQKDSKAGAAYLFKQGACGSWGQVARLTAADSQAGDDFANSVAFSGNTVLIGAPAINSPSESRKPGAVYYHDLDLPTTYCLTVDRTTGTGAGTVTSTSPGDINCGDACAASYPDGTMVTLIATPASGSIFKGWSGACSGDNATCQVTMTQALSVTANFEDLPTLKVFKHGVGSSNTVTSEPSGIQCGSDCSEDYTKGTVVTLTATPTPGSSIFSGWDGACSGADPCRLTMDQNYEVTASFIREVVPRTKTVIIDFSPYGIWIRRSDQSWVQLHTLTAVQFVTADLDKNGQTDLVINFGYPYGLWVWMNNSSWVRLHDLAPASITVADLDGNGKADLAINFGSSYGIWLWMNNQSWVKLHSLAPVSITTADLDGNGKADLAINFGSSYGIWLWMNNQSWVKLHSLAPVSITVADLDGNDQADLAVNFGSSYGIWLWMNSQSWVKLHDLAATAVTATDLDGNGQADLAINFGSPYGIWLWMNNQSWVKLHDLSPVSITTSRLDDNARQDLIIDFGNSYGIWLWMNNQNWAKLHDLSAKQILASPE